MLQDHRFKHKSLPDSITFRKVVESKPEELEKLVRNYEMKKTK